MFEARAARRAGYMRWTLDALEREYDRIETDLAEWYGGRCPQYYALVGDLNAVERALRAADGEFPQERSA